MKVCFDPGHYAGANIGPGTYREGNAMLDFGLALQKEYGVVLTRSTGANLDFKARADKARSADCDTLVSLHTNAPVEAAGIIVFYSTKKPEDKELAETLGKELAKATGISFRAAKTRTLQMPVLSKEILSKEATKTLQTELNLQGYNCGVADGVFGKNTDKQVRLYQKDRGLVADGIVGAKTWDNLLDVQKRTDYYAIIRQSIRAGIKHAFIVEHGSHWEFAVDTEKKINACVEVYGRLLGLNKKAEGENAMPVIKRGTANREATKTLQAKLNALGYNCGAVDGIFGANTDKQVRLYQKANKLAADGIAGAKTWALLLGMQKEVEPLKYSKTRKFGSNVHVVEMNPKEYRLDITEGIPGKLEKLSTIFGEPKLDEVAWVRMNAQFFHDATRGYGAFIDPTDDLPDKPSFPGYTDLTYRDGKLVVGAGGDFTIGTSYGLINRGITHFKNGNNFKTLMNARHPRSMAGSLRNGNNVFIVVDGRWGNLSLGMTAQQQAATGQELGCVELANFDGGGSSQLMIGDAIKNRPSDGKERAIISAIVAYRKYTLEELPVLKKGSKGVYINLLQRLLRTGADGIFGNGTLLAVKAYQKKHKLAVDGIVGKQTWSKLIEGRG